MTECSRCSRDMSRYKPTCGVMLCNNCRYEVSIIEDLKLKRGLSDYITWVMLEKEGEK